MSSVRTNLEPGFITINGKKYKIVQKKCRQKMPKYNVVQAPAQLCNELEDLKNVEIGNGQFLYAAKVHLLEAKCSSAMCDETFLLIHNPLDPDEPTTHTCWNCDDQSLTEIATFQWKNVLYIEIDERERILLQYAELSANSP